MIYRILRPQSTKEEILKVDNPLSLQELQKLVSGYIEFIHLGYNCYAVVNEDGKRLNLDPNNFIPYVVGVAVVGILEDDEFVGIPDHLHIAGCTHFTTSL